MGPFGDRGRHRGFDSHSLGRTGQPVAVGDSKPRGAPRGGAATPGNSQRQPSQGGRSEVSSRTDLSLGDWLGSRRAGTLGASLWPRAGRSGTPGHLFLRHSHPGRRSDPHAGRARRRRNPHADTARRIGCHLCRGGDSCDVAHSLRNSLVVCPAGIRGSRAPANSLLPSPGSVNPQSRFMASEALERRERLRHVGRQRLLESMPLSGDRMHKA